MRYKIAIPVAISSVAILIIILFVTGVADNISAHILQDKTDKIPQKVVATNNSFAIHIYKEISSRDEFANSNIFFSPINMHMSFSSLYEGAGGNTASQMKDVFRFEPDSQERHELIKDIVAYLNYDKSHVTLNMANALWSTKQYELYDSYIATLRDTYQTHVDNVDFSSEESKDVINQWAFDNTNGLIKKVYKKPINHADNSLVLTNIAYINGVWQYEFPKSMYFSGKANFLTDTGVVPAVEYLFVRNTTFNFAEIDNAYVLQLPYATDRFSMLLALPSQTFDIKDLENTLSHHLIKKWQSGLKEREHVYVWIPKFSIKTNYDLIDILKGMQIQNAFSKENANLPDIVEHRPPDEKPHISIATHSAFINVNEKGVEAAREKPDLYHIQSMPKSYNFQAIQPFIFIIQDNESGAILFMGRVSDPTAG